MAAQPKQRAITHATLDALAQSVEREYETEMAHILKARQAIGGNTSARRQQLDYAELVQHHQHIGAMDIIVRMRVLLAGEWSPGHTADEELP